MSYFLSKNILQAFTSVTTVTPFLPLGAGAGWGDITAPQAIQKEAKVHNL